MEYCRLSLCFSQPSPTQMHPYPPLVLLQHHQLQNRFQKVIYMILIIVFIHF